MGELLKDTLYHVRSALKRYGYNRLYDDNQCGVSTGYKTERMIGKIHQSYRTIIILTCVPQLTNQESISNIQTSFNEVMNTERKLLFIMTTRMMKYIIKSSSTKCTSLLFLRKALKMNKYILLDVNRKQRSTTLTFKTQLQLAMPKLKPTRTEYEETSKNEAEIGVKLTKTRDNENEVKIILPTENSNHLSNEVESKRTETLWA